jgi:CubicO group peptidase (beta-lactamase class C family)
MFSTRFYAFCPGSSSSFYNSYTVFRVGSLTKLIVVYTFLIKAGDARFNDPVAKYVLNFWKLHRP